MSQYLTISANFRTGQELPTIEHQYEHLWELAVFLGSIGHPLGDWHPPADTEELTLMNAAFDIDGPTPAALALAKAEKSKSASNVRGLGVWNGIEGVGGMMFKTMYISGITPSFFHLSEDGNPAFEDYQCVADLVRMIVKIWNPMVIKVIPEGYDEVAVFPDRPPVGWMIYLPYKIDPSALPEAQKIIGVAENGKAPGTIIVSTTERFDTDNPAHVKNANAIETRLVDQDLLPTMAEFVERY